MTDQPPSPQFPTIDLHMMMPGETLLQTWTPNLRIFLRKLGWVGLMTAVFLGSGTLFVEGSTTRILLIWIVSTPVAMAFYIFIFGDYEEWFRRRGERWILTNQRLIFLAPNSTSDPISVDMRDIADIKSWMWWTLRITLLSGQKMTMDYLPNRSEIRASILAVRDQATGAEHG